MERLFNNPINIKEAIDNKFFPTITMWNRLEGRPRTHHFDKALKAEVRDALWMLCKQWQTGEFKGEDAGSPVYAKIKLNTAPINEFSPGNNPFKPLEESVPMEALIEQKLIPFERNKTKISLDLRLQLGRYWLKLLKSKLLEAYYQAYVERHDFKLPPRDRSTDYIYAHKEELQQWMAVKGRCLDGYELVRSIQNGNPASVGITLSDPGHQTDLDELGDKLVRYFNRNYHQPEKMDENAWLPDRLEYKAACLSDSSSEKITLAAEEYYQGHLDWYAFNLEASPGSGEVESNIMLDTFIPTNVEFEGMPDKRWWKFEDYKTSFGDISPSTTDLSKLLLIEFGLTFANDWFLIPFTLPIGTVSEIQGLSVTDNFGDVFWVEATEQGGDSLNDWSMFRQKSTLMNRKLFLCPSSMKVQEGDALEEIGLVRDEMANMVWGLEKVIPSSVGKGVQGGEFALQIRKYHEDIVGSPLESEIPFAANVYYNAMTDVPENWIPFIPTHADGHKRKIQLQRASQLRIIQGDLLIPEKIKPKTSLLREGLEDGPKPNAYFIHEEEVLRSGTRVVQGFQRTRWFDGEVFVWLGTKKKAGRGEGSSELAFDQLKNVK